MTCKQIVKSCRYGFMKNDVCKPAVPLDTLEQVMQTMSTRYDPSGALGFPKLPKTSLRILGVLS